MPSYYTAQYDYKLTCTLIRFIFLFDTCPQKQTNKVEEYYYDSWYDNTVG